MRILLETIGCRLNFAELEEMAAHFTRAGHRIVASGEYADIVLFNSCAVTQAASRKSRQIIRQLRRANPAAALVATGCYAQLSPREVKTMGADLVVSNVAKDNLSSILARAGLLSTDDTLAPDTAPIYCDPEIHRRTRAFIKVQDGCDQRCTFCIVTTARGPNRSRDVGKLITEITRRVNEGCQEVVLTGVHLGSFGHDWGNRCGLKHLVQEILTRTAIPRLRLSSLEPWDIEPHFFELWRNNRLLPHLHLPLQSGSDATLRRMARRTTKASYELLLTQARAQIPNLSITTDLIVGFPGETDEDFAESLAFAEKMGFSGLHVFRYSVRTGTRASLMSAHVPPAVAQDRSKRMHLLGSRLQRAFHTKLLHRTLPVLWESGQIHGSRLRWSGLTSNYARVLTQTDASTDLHNRVIETRMVETIPGAILGDTNCSGKTNPSTSSSCITMDGQSYIDTMHRDNIP